MDNPAFNLIPWNMGKYIKFFDKLKITRREFFTSISTLVGATLLLPNIVNCKPQSNSHIAYLPFVKPQDWDPIAFNKQRANHGGVPKAYLKSINGVDGENKHIGKHLPYIPQLGDTAIPDGYIPIMWGNPSKGHTMHPNAPQNSAKQYEGHWYNWIRLRKSTLSGEEEEVQSEYNLWPGNNKTSLYLSAKPGTPLTAKKGIFTVYLAKLPKNVKTGDTLRIHAHCKTHGEWVDFISL